jgi:hypothetical protein
MALLEVQHQEETLREGTRGRWIRDDFFFISSYQVSHLYVIDEQHFWTLPMRLPIPCPKPIPYQ